MQPKRIVVVVILVQDALKAELMQAG